MVQFSETRGRLVKHLVTEVIYTVLLTLLSARSVRFSDCFNLPLNLKQQLFISGSKEKMELWVSNVVTQKYDQSKYSIYIIYYYFSILSLLSILPVKLGEMCFVSFSDPLKS